MHTRSGIPIVRRLRAILLCPTCSTPLDAPRPCACNRSARPVSDHIHAEIDTARPVVPSSGNLDQLSTIRSHAA